MSRLFRKSLLVAVPALILFAGWMTYRWHSRREPARVALEFARAVEEASKQEILQHLQVPKFMLDRSQAEKESLLLELLDSEINAAGAHVLVEKGQFGPLKEIFPEDATIWATSFNVSPDDCVAFRMEREGILAELVLLKSGDKYLILRCNNVRQMAGDISQP